MTGPNRIVDVGDELDVVPDELDQFLNDTGVEVAQSLHGTGEEESIHAGIMHAMEDPSLRGERPLTAVIMPDPLHI